MIFEGVNGMNELISPQQSDTLVIVIAVLVAVIGFSGSLWTLRHRGIGTIVRAIFLCDVAALSLWPLWKLHNWLTRFDPQTKYFGLESVKVLLLEAVLFIFIGALFGWSWRKVTALEEVKELRRK